MTSKYWSSWREATLYFLVEQSCLFEMNRLPWNVASFQHKTLKLACSKQANKYKLCETWEKKKKDEEKGVSFFFFF